MEPKKWLEILSSKELADFYQEWLKNCPHLERFPFPQKLIEYFYSKEITDYESKDKILHFLISKSKSNEESSVLDVYLFNLLLYPFVRISLNRWEKYLLNCGFESIEIWDEIWVAFRTTINEFDLDKRKEKIGLFFQGKISNHLRGTYRKNIRYIKSKVSFEETTVPKEELPTPQVDEYFEPEELIELERFLEELIEKKVIDSVEKYLIVESRVKKRPFKQVAVEVSQSYLRAYRKRGDAEFKVARILRKIIAEKKAQVKDDGL